METKKQRLNQNDFKGFGWEKSEARVQSEHVLSAVFQ